MCASAQRTARRLTYAVCSSKRMLRLTLRRAFPSWQVRHCALSLVGEPIMYPEINTLVGLLHERRISTFLVTNAQFPDCIQKLVRRTGPRVCSRPTAAEMCSVWPPCQGHRLGAHMQLRTFGLSTCLPT